MTGTAWESAGELWQIYQRPVVRIPTNKKCIRIQYPTRMFETMDQYYAAGGPKGSALPEPGNWLCRRLMGRKYRAWPPSLLRAGF